MVQDLSVEKQWKKILMDLNEKFGEALDLQSVLFLIGVNELGKGHREYKKDEKLNIMHIAICTLLSPWGYYEYVGRDEDGWPHWKVKEKLPPLNAMEQEYLMKQAIVEYFKEGHFSPEASAN